MLWRPIKDNGGSILHVLLMFLGFSLISHCIIGMYIFFVILAETTSYFYCMHIWNKSTLVVLHYPGKLLKAIKIYRNFFTYLFLNTLPCIYTIV